MAEPDLNLLIALDALLHEVSVAGAARRLGLSASAMSRTLTRLRETTDDPLLVRAGRRMVLTPGAESLRERARNAAHEARAVLRPSTTEIDFARLQRDITLRANDGFVDGFGAVLIAAVTAKAPLVRLRFTPKVEKSDVYLREGSVDLEIGVIANMGPEVRVQTLFRDRFVGVVRTGHPLALAAVVSADAYVAHGHVVASRRGRITGPVDDALAALGLARRVVAVVPSFPAATIIARDSDLVALVPASYLGALPVPAEGAASGIHAFELPVAVGDIVVSQMWHPRLEFDPVHRWLRQLVLEVCRRRVPA